MEKNTNGYFGVMLDLSNACVMKPEKVKEYALYLKKLGYNMIQLYTEDTYEVEKEPYFGYLRGGYTEEELKDIVGYCDGIGMEVIPCIEGLAHLSTVFYWKDYAAINDTDDILLADEQRTYLLFDNIFRTLRKCFTSKRVNIGLDEAHNLGLGNYLKKHGYTDKAEIFARHLKKLTEIARRYDFEPMIWSDMLFRVAGGDYYNVDADRFRSAAKLIPEDVSVVYWEYFFYKTEQYEKTIDIHKILPNELWYAGAVHTYIGFTASNKMSNATLLPAMQACKNKDVKNILITLWGAGECSYFLALPSLCYARCVYEGITDDKIIKERFCSAVGDDYDNIIGLDAANTLAMDYLAAPEVDFSRYVVYQDIFKGYFDTVLKENSVKDYLKKAREFERIKKSSRFTYLFDTQIKLLELMYLKHDLGILLRRAYRNRDMKQLEKLHCRILDCAAAAEDFYRAFRNQWFTENKPDSFDINDLKLGGLIKRLLSCAERLKDYLDGKTEKIDELEKDLLPFNGTGQTFLFWQKIATVNRLG